MRDSNLLASPEGERTAIARSAGRGGTLRLVLGLVVLLAVLALIRLHSYVLFHSLAELFSAAVALAVAAIAWHTRRIARNPFLLFLGIALAFVALNDTLHLLAYKGMGVFHPEDANLATQLWLTGRYEFTLALLIAPLLIGSGVRGLGRRPTNDASPPGSYGYAPEADAGNANSSVMSMTEETLSRRPGLSGGRGFVRRRSVGAALAGFGGVWAALLLSIFAWPVLPAAFVPGQGLTDFKKISEYVVAALLVVALGLLLSRRREFERRILVLVSASIVVTIISELSFTLYMDVDGPVNLLGHFLKIIAFFLLYLAIVERTLTAPYSLLFRGLREREMALERSGREFRSAFEQAAVGMAHVAPNGQFRLGNRRLAELLGYELAELAGLGLSDVLLPGETTVSDLVSALTDERSEPTQQEAVLLRKDGSPIWTRLTLSTVPDAAGGLDYVAFVVEDITEAKRIQREREEMMARLDGVGQVSEAAMQTLELHELMDSVLRLIVRLMDAHAALLMLKRGGRLVTVASHGLKGELVEEFTLELGEGAAGEVAVTTEPLYIEEVERDPRVVGSILEANGIRSLLAVPLVRRDELLGVLQVDWRDVRPVTPTDVRFLALLADRVSAGVFNADLYRKQKEVAEVLQKEMLALPETLSGLGFQHVYRSASEGAYVGGDFYDVFPDTDGTRAWLVMGDVSGHGLEAATTASLLREITRAYALESADPGLVMQKINRAVVQRLGFRHYATMFLGALELRNGALTYCSAGHPPGFVVASHQPPIELTSRGVPVGAFPDAAYATETVTLDGGQAVFLYTDGVTEARRGTVLFGEERLVAVLGEGHQAEGLPSAVLEAIEEFSAGYLIDDVAVLCAWPSESRSSFAPVQRPSGSTTTAVP